ncbi:MAG: S41 family peptidase [Maribacter litoralis]|uniref:S41 family peptidase n=1 Tax=Maribacter litoralis TaxID=2059726 RepID=UPI0032988E0C
MEKSYNDINEAIDYYRNLKKEKLEHFNFEDENELNNLGYQLLNDERVEDAIKIFTLLTLEFPKSYNAYDSLGEAYLKNGNQNLAIKNYEKSLVLNAKNENAERILVSLEFENRNKNKFEQVYQKQQYIEDLDKLAYNLTTVNPHPYKFMPKEDFWRVVNEKKSLITDNTTYGEFIWHCSELVSNINCVHSGLGYFNQESEMLPVELRFPLETRFIDKKLFVTKPLINSNVKEGVEILTINGVKIEDLRKEIFRHIPSQGHIETGKKLFYSAYGTAYIAYALGFPEKYTIRVRDSKSPLKLEQLTIYEPAKRHFATNLCESKDLCLDYVDDKTAILTIINSGAYYGTRFSIFKDFIDTSFQEIQSKNINYLIIDMRSNSGGPGNTGAYLLQYLVEEPFIYKTVAEGSNMAGQSFKPFGNRFKEEVYFLIDGEGGSTTGHILSFIKQRKLATIIGEELGGNHFCTGGQRLYKLPNTDVFYYIGRNTNISSADNFQADRGIMPDYFVTQSIEDYLDNTDEVMNYTLKHIHKK